MNAINPKKIFLPTLLLGAVILALAIQKVFSLNMEGGARSPGSFGSEKNLLLNAPGGILPESDARAVIKSLDEFVAKDYTVQRNEWLEKIAAGYGVPAQSLRSTDNLENTAVLPKDRLIVQNKRGMVHVAKEGETLEGLIQAYEKLGAKRETILSANSWDEVTEFADGNIFLKGGTKLWIPNARRSYPIYVRPVMWSRISSRMGVRKHPVLRTRIRHQGYDLVAPYGASVFASENGIITFAGWQGGYGNMIEIQHAKTTTRYGHLSAIYVEVGQRVKRKFTIGRVGSTGLSTGPHLHFEVRRNSDGKIQNPGKYLY